MIFILKQIKQIFITTVFLLCTVTAISQVKSKSKPAKTLTPVSKQLAEFYRLTADAGLQFTFPKEFKEIKASYNEDFSYDYAMELPGHDFEIWIRVKSQKKEWEAYELTKNEPNNETANPDSAYVTMGQAQVEALAGDQNAIKRAIPADILARYNASAGKTYLLNLQDLTETKHYKYALLITLQKDHYRNCFSAMLF